MAGPQSQESQARFTMASLLFAITTVGGVALWGGSIQTEVREARAEYQIVLQEVRELRRELHSFRLEQAELHAKARR